MSDKQCHLGDVCGEPLPPMRPIPRRQYRNPRWVENGTSVIIGIVAVVIFGALMVMFLVLLFLFAAHSSVAQIQVPPECVELAKREGYPTDVMSKSQAAQARIRMKRLGDDDPIVRSCRNAVAQLRAMHREMRK